MTFAEFLFVAIDKICDRGQNKKKIVKFKGVDFNEELDVAYGESESEKLDLYYLKRPEGEKYPVMFLIHGGGFVAGDKHYRRGLSKWMADKGFFVVNVNYALAPQYKFPIGLKQLVKALNWVGENAEKYNLDLDNMCVSGDSAGGYYSAMLACIATNKSLQERFGVSTDLRFRTASLDCGIYDVQEALSQKLPFNLTDKVLHDFSGIHVKDLENYEYKDVLAPYVFVDENFPISFITYAEKDVFCKGQGQKLIKKLQDLGIHVEQHHSTKFLDNHCFPLNWDKGAAKENVKLVGDFLKRAANKEV
ncbi:MAG: alpha/beta hydrolase [Bacteroides sp.]|nr:alpha/beta hydrolase [Bacillota bacterium]MCM1394475.1 alpha/beta hydrolase [[Eubacterium] siraeum]MCM1456119.1 alpha/beta hydrolase [Bacteroides sp.]